MLLLSWSDNFCCYHSQTGLTALSIAQRLGYISVVEVLKNLTDVILSPMAAEEKYKVIAPESMQEAALSDSEEEGGSNMFVPLKEIYNQVDVWFVV